MGDIISIKNKQSWLKASIISFYYEKKKEKMITILSNKFLIFNF